MKLLVRAAAAAAATALLALLGACSAGAPATTPYALNVKAAA